MGSVAKEMLLVLKGCKIPAYAVKEKLSDAWPNKRLHSSMRLSQHSYPNLSRCDCAICITGHSDYAAVGSEVL